MPLQLFVQPQSGQLLGQGIQSGAESLAQGLRQYAQNKLMANSAIGQFEAAAQANPDILAFLDSGKAPDAVNSAYKNLRDGGGLDVKKAALLSQFANSYAQQKTAAQEQEARGLAIKQAKMKMDFMQQFMVGQQGAPTGQSSGSGAPASVQGFMPQQAPNPNAAPENNAFMPTRPKPTIRDTMKQIVQGTGQLPDPSEVISQWRTDVTDWNKSVRPIGYVAGGIETDKDGIKVQSYYRVNRQNDGSIVQEKDPIKVYASAGAPGTVLSPDTFTPIPAQPKGTVSQTAAQLPPSKEQQEAILEATNDLKTMGIQMTRLNELEKINGQLNQKRWSRLAPITGTDTGNKAETVLFGDTSGTNFDSASSNFIADLMGGVKNIRNQQEFKAVTGSVPKASMDADTRGARLQDIRNRLVMQIGRTSKALANLKSGALPSSAWDNAMTPIAEGSKVGNVFNTEAEAADAARQGLIKAGDKITVGGKPGKWTE